MNLDNKEKGYEERIVWSKEKGREMAKDDKNETYQGLGFLPS